jgi:hypothetical protein
MATELGYPVTDPVAIEERFRTIVQIDLAGPPSVRLRVPLTSRLAPAMRFA